MHKCWRSQEQACWPYMAGRENRRGEWMGLSVGNLSYRYLQISTFPQPKSVQKSFYMWSPSVTGHGLHRLGINLTEFDLSGAARDDPPKTPTKSNEVKSKSSSASPRWTSIWPHWAQVGEVHVRLLMDFTYDGSDNCDCNFGTFDDFGVRNDQ